jgi:hypothetical protein
MHRRYFLGTLASLASPVYAQLQLPTTANNMTANAGKESTMSSIESEEFQWSITVSNYNIDLGDIDIETLINDCWFADAKGNKRQFYGSRGGYGTGGTPIGGNRETLPLPKTLHLQYYDYQEGRFYKLDVELPQRKLYALFQQKTIQIDADDKPVMPRYDEITIGIAPGGFIMLWVRTYNGYDEVELLGPLQALNIDGMTVESYNSSVRESFWLASDRWDYLKNNDGIKPETLAKLKTGWLPDNLYYRQRRIKYPWRYRMTGNARLLEFKDSQDNNERFYIGPWQMAMYNSMGALRGVPIAATFWFVDNAGKRHSIYLGFFKGDRVTGEKNVSEGRNAFETIFPKRELWQNDLVPGEDDMATVVIRVSDDLQTYSTSLVKGNTVLSFPAHRAQFFNLEPYTHWPKGVTPDAAAIKRLQNGPDF